MKIFKKKKLVVIIMTFNSEKIITKNLIASKKLKSDILIIDSFSTDKTIKIWGLDFGDCHRSLVGHTDSITSLRFLLDTHYFFTGSKDGNLKYWDADR